MRQRIFDLVGPARDGDYASRAYDIFIVLVAIVSLVPMLFDPLKTSQFEKDVLWVLDVVTAYLLLFDYILRWMTHDIKKDKDWKAFVAYPFTPMAIIDILAILPTLNVVPQTLRFLRILRVVKVFRYSKNLLVVTNACARARHAPSHRCSSRLSSTCSSSPSSSSTSSPSPSTTTSTRSAGRARR